jgi:ribonuclease Z
MFSVTILGASGAIPAYGRTSTSQLVEIDNECFLVDCAEGTQHQIVKFNLQDKVKNINHIFISHLHGDHYYGLIGLLSTMNMLGRENDLYLYSPRELAEVIIVQAKASYMNFAFKIIFKETISENIVYNSNSNDKHYKSDLLFENEKLTVTTIPLNHRIPCTGFLFKEKPKKYRINKEKINEQIAKKIPLPIDAIKTLLQGYNVLDKNGIMLYSVQDYTLPPKKSDSYAFCSDTCYDERIVEIIKNVDLLYHESTFLEEDAERAKATFHSTAKQAANIAKLANVSSLLLGHFSARYKEIDAFLEEAKTIFHNVKLSTEGETFSITN